MDECTVMINFHDPGCIRRSWDFLLEVKISVTFFVALNKFIY